MRDMVLRSLVWLEVYSLKLKGIGRPASYLVRNWETEKTMGTTLQGFHTRMDKAERKITSGVYGLGANGAVGDRKYDA